MYTKNENHGREPVMICKKTLPPTYLFISILIMTVLHLLLPVLKIIPFPWNLLGLMPLALGLASSLIADGAFKKHGTTVRPFEQPTTLVTNGVFRVSRNPMYLGFVLILIGIAILMGSLTPYPVIPVFAAVIDRVFIVNEEKMLHTAFGENWLDYKNKVRRWI
jgi:protein-S-isoprenylcysteine O-methyltransferase Ste14